MEAVRAPASGSSGHSGKGANSQQMGSKQHLRQQELSGAAAKATKEEESKLKTINLERPARELLIWSLLVGKLQMAELFWTMEKEPVAAALLSSMILKAMVGRTDDFTDKEDFQRGGAQFEDHAWGVLDQCYREDERRALLLINRELKFYGDSSCIYLAAEGESIKFMAHPCCQDFLTSTWMGRLSAKNSMTRFSIGILCGIVCPWLVPSVMLYKLTDREIERQVAEQQQQKTPSLTARSEDAAADPESGGPTYEGGDRKSLLSHIRQASVLNCGQTCQRMKEFYMAPVVRFVYNTFSYLTFLFMFSYLLLFDLKHDFTVMEYIVISWIVTLLLEEVKQATLSGISFSTYISDSWNKLDCTAVGLFVLGLVLRLISLLSESPETVLLSGHAYDVILTDGLFVAARICYAFSLFAFCIRLMYIFSFHIALGPKLIMIGKMVINDLVPFMVILLVFILGYGVAAQSIAYPTGFYTPNQDFNKTSPKKMTHTEIFIHFLTRAYFQMFGDFGLDSIQAEDSGCLDEGKCPHWTAKWLLPIMLGVYVLLTNILMFNLLIAMFSSTYESINQFSALHWNYQRYSMIKEYIERSPLAPPLIIFWHAYELVFFIQLRYQGRKLSELEDPLRISYKDNVKKERELVKWEHMKAMDFLRQDQECHGKKGGRSDSKSVIVRTSGPQLGAGGLLPAAADVAKQMSDATSGIGLELEKKFKSVDTQLTKISADFDQRLTDLSNTLNGFSVAVQALREGQERLASVQQARAVAGSVNTAEAQQQQLNQLEQRVLEAVTTAYQSAPPAWFQEIARTAAAEALASTPVSVGQLDQEVLQQLASASSSSGTAERRWRRRGAAPASSAGADLTSGSAAVEGGGLQGSSLTSAASKAAGATAARVAEPRGATAATAATGATAAEEGDDEEDDFDDNEDLEEDAATIRPVVDDPGTGRLIEYRSLQHRLWRYVPFNFEQYPGMRMNVPPDKIPWEIDYRDYFAFDASEEVLIFPNEESYDGPTVPLQSINFNQLDSRSGLRRQSMMGRYRLDTVSSAPLNPMGRTGLKGKGLLPRWGPNNAVVIAMTRWSRAPSGAVIHRLGHPILQVLSLFRHKQFCLPWFLTDHFDNCDYDDCVPALLKNFISRRLKQLLQKKDARQEINAIMKGRAEQIFKGYMDDHLNADNAWIEAVVINVHESDNWKFSDAMLKVFSEVDSDEQARWMEVAYSTAMRSSHCEMLKTIASNHRAYF
uniref:Ion_trans domain-containing protein n=1 Tax=Macrostomum lignano TaxID=282301 RepID=A0A1I8GTE3_9PLAT